MDGAAGSEKGIREEELRRDFEAAIEGILALDAQPSGSVSSTRSFRFGKYDITFCAKYSDKVSGSSLDGRLMRSLADSIVQKTNPR